MTRTTKKSKLERSEEIAQEALQQLVVHGSAAASHVQFFHRNDRRRRAGERIAPPTPKDPDPELAAITYLETELAYLLVDLDSMGKAIATLKTSLAEQRQDRLRARRIT